VVGAWGELNGAFKQLLRRIVERQVGGGSDGIRSVAWQHVRRHILIAVAKANAEWLLHFCSRCASPTIHT